jgi:IS605 OrfB family transposase
MKFATALKKRAANAVVNEFRSAVNLYIKILWNEPGIGLDKKTLDKLPDLHLTQRYKSNALKQALAMIFSAKKSARALKRPCSRPVFRGFPVLDGKFVAVEDGRKSFDLVIRLSTLKKGRKISIPTRKTKVLNDWLSEPDSRMIQGCELRPNGLVVWVEMPDRPPEVASAKDADPEEVLGIDMGMDKLIADSRGNFYGTDCKSVLKPIQRRKGGKTRMGDAARARRDNYFNHIVDSLPWGTFKVLVCEDLRHIKRGKSKKRGRNFRRCVSAWTVSRVLARVGQRCEENRVLLVTVPPAYTSQTCPQCGYRDNGNRNAGMFKCIRCGHAADADEVGAKNIRHLGLYGSLESPYIRKETA